MFRNTMPRYEVLSEEAMATLDRGWRRLMTEIGVEFMDIPDKAQREWLNTWLAAHTDRPVALMFHHTLGEGDNWADFGHTLDHKAWMGTRPCRSRPPASGTARRPRNCSRRGRN